jgi:hypothetical protein
MPAPKSVKRLVDHFDQDRKVFISSDYKEGQLPKAETPRKRESLQHQIAATGDLINALVYELYGLTEKEIWIVEGGRK